MSLRRSAGSVIVVRESEEVRRHGGAARGYFQASDAQYLTSLPISAASGARTFFSVLLTLSDTCVSYKTAGPPLALAYLDLKEASSLMVGLTAGSGLLDSSRSIQACWETSSN